MTEIIQFPIAEREWTEAEVDYIQAEAYPELESEVCDLMGEMVEGLIMECTSRDVSSSAPPSPL